MVTLADPTTPDEPAPADLDRWTGVPDRVAPFRAAPGQARIIDVDHTRLPVREWSWVQVRVRIRFHGVTSIRLDGHGRDLRVEPVTVTGDYGKKEVVLLTLQVELCAGQGAHPAARHHGGRGRPAPGRPRERADPPPLTRLLAGASVDALAQQVGVADVAGVLLDQVHDDVADLCRLAVDVDVRAEIGSGPQHLLAVRDLAPPRRPRLGDDLRRRRRRR